MAKDNKKHHPIFEDKKSWIENDHMIWLVSTITLARNIEKFNFPGKLESSSQKQILSLIKNQLGEIKNFKKSDLIDAENLTPLEKEFLVEHFLTTQSFVQTHSGEGVIVDKKGLFLGTVNIRDHLTLSLLDSDNELENNWNRLVEIESKLGEALSYSYSQKFGFLTADPMHCGTGLKVAVFLQLSGLIHTGKIDEALANYADEGISISGIHGGPNEIIGDIVVVQNNYSLGLTEENIISNIRGCCTKLQVEEKTTRKQIIEEQNTEMKDRVSRAYGILVHSYNIETVEALNALSLLKLGVQLDWVKGISIKKLNKLFFNCRRAHLLQHFDQEIPQEELIHKRAEFIHEHLKGVELKI